MKIKYFINQAKSILLTFRLRLFCLCDSFEYVPNNVDK